MLKYMPGICLRSGSGRVGCVPSSSAVKAQALCYTFSPDLWKTKVFRVMVVKFQRASESSRKLVETQLSGAVAC